MSFPTEGLLLEDATPCHPHIVKEEPPTPKKQNCLRGAYESLRGDIASICLLLFLYLLQGIPLGLIGTIPMILSGKSTSYGLQAVFSFAFWPFSLKLLWAPFVDSFYISRFGRRKSWLVPCQYLIGSVLLTISYNVPVILGEDASGKPPNVYFLLMIFLPLNFLAATQDIAVDGWALTILSRKNVGYASTCNAVGVTIGFFLGNVVFLSLESADFCNTFLRSAANQKDVGILTLEGYMFFWGLVFLITTTLVLIFKREVDNSLQIAVPAEEPTDLEKNSDDKEMELGLFETYKVLWKIMQLKPMMYMLFLLITGKIAFAATDGIKGLKLISMGIPKDRLASFGLFLTPLQIILPWTIGKYTSGPKPLNIFLIAYPCRMLMGGLFAALVWWTPSFREESGKFESSIYVIWIIGYMLHQVTSYSMFISMMAFFAQISDPRIGGTYMTLLNTLNNMGGNWPVTVALWLTDKLTFKDCVQKGTKTVLFACNSKTFVDQCQSEGNVCEMAIDGYYVAVGICSLVGLLWYKMLFNKIRYLQKIPREEWRICKTNTSSEPSTKAK